MHTFDTPNPVRRKLTSGAGAVEINTGTSATSTVELNVLGGGDQEREAIDSTTVTRTEDGSDLIAALPRGKRGLFGNRLSIAIAVTLPAGSSARVQTESADVATHGELHEIDAKSGSGRITVDQAVRADLQAGSGDVEVSHGTGTLTAKTGSGDVDRLDGEETVKSGSGDVEVRAARGQNQRHHGIGRRGRRGRGRNRAVWLDLDTVTGDVTNALDDVDAPGDSDARLELRAKTATGDITIRRS